MRGLWLWFDVGFRLQAWSLVLPNYVFNRLQLSYPPMRAFNECDRPTSKTYRMKSLIFPGVHIATRNLLIVSCLTWGIYNDVSYHIFQTNIFMFNFQIATWMLGWQVNLYGLDNFLNVRSCVQINSRVRWLPILLCLHAWTSRLILTWFCAEQRKRSFRERDLHGLASSISIDWSPLHVLNYWANEDFPI